MKITRLRTNRINRPVGFDFGKPHFSYVVEDAQGKNQMGAQIIVALDDSFKDIVYDSGMRENIDSLAHEMPIPLLPCTRYFWKVRVKTDAGEEGESDVSFFETPREGEWIGKWISPKADKSLQMTIYKTVRLSGKVKSARMYMTGLGVYELYLNGEKQGEEYLMPGLHGYDSWIQYQTYELPVRQGENLIEIMLGNGWYKGRFGLNKPEENYGDRLTCIGEIVICYEDGRREVIGTDDTWLAKRNHVVESGIYSGECQDDTLDLSQVYAVELTGKGTGSLMPRLSPYLTAHERRYPTEIIRTPKGETVFDFGQNMVGWMVFRNTQRKGVRLRFQFGEILQQGNFYRDNLRKAKAEFVYISDGIEKEIRPHFTFYGFRYVKVEGWEGEIKPEDFTAVSIYSDMDELGYIETSDPLVNRLFENAKWGQKDNFLDVPTDCPQRDERMGWTGDAQVFSGTACYNMDTYAFYTKYGYDLSCEQRKAGGAVLDVVPAVNADGHTSTVWGDAATVIPWNVYLHYGDKRILERQYDSMKAWVDYMKGEDDRAGGKGLWLSGWHYADWLALDGKVEGGVFGATDPYFIASAYYYYSTKLVSKTARVLQRVEDERKYREHAEKIREAFFREYFTPAGRLCVNTMTAYVLVLYMHLVPEGAYEKTCEGLFSKLRENGYHLCTGFAGTPCLCPVLSENGMNDLAYRLLMEKEFPSWLYEVLMGATTIWERWNSLLPDGTVSGTEMNSMNHYAYGSIVEWMYRYMIGIQPVEEKPGFKRAVIAPKPDYRLAWAEGKLHTASGMYCAKWHLEEQKITIYITVPFDCEAEVILPDADKDNLQYSGAEPKNIEQKGTDVTAELTAGNYVFSYSTTTRYREKYGIDSLIDDILKNERAAAILKESFFDVIGEIPFYRETPVLRDLLNAPFVHFPYEKQEWLDQLLNEV